MDTHCLKETIVKLHVELHVKFRVNLWFTHVDLGKVDLVRDVPLPEIALPVQARELLHFSGPGASLVIGLARA